MVHPTAISRKDLSGPMKTLKGKDLIQGKILDYGCGRGDDVRTLKSWGYDISGYDPNTLEYSEKCEGSFDTITCTYVLNVIPEQSDRAEVLSNIFRKLKPGGSAYITVRADKKSLLGWTSKGTYQTFVKLDLPILAKTSTYITYVYHNE